MQGKNPTNCPITPAPEILIEKQRIKNKRKFRRKKRRKEEEEKDDSNHGLKLEVVL